MTWTETTLGAIAPFSYGKSLPQAERKSGRVPVYGSGGITGFHNEPLIDGPACIIGRKGSVGRTYLEQGPSWPIDTTFYTHGSNIIDLDYLYFLLQTLPLQESSDSAVPGLNRDYAHSLNVRIPDKFVQQRIANTLKSLDSKIRINSEISTTLESIAQTIFKSWFVDFDPVHAKARGEQPEGMDSKTAALFPSSFEDSEIGPIPAGWSVTSLTEISEFLNGLALQKFPAVDGEDNLPVIKIPQLKTGIASGSGEASNAIPSKYVVSDGDILFSWSGALEVVLWAGGKGALNQHLFKVIPKSFPKWFSLHTTLIHLPEFREIAASKATTMGHIQRGHLSDALCATPNELLLSKATEVLQPLLDASVAHRVENRTLVALRDSLLPRLISGELEIPEELLGE